MATRRPTVPKAAPRPQATTDPAKEAPGPAAVIRADFGGANSGAKDNAAVSAAVSAARFNGAAAKSPDSTAPAPQSAAGNAGAGQVRGRGSTKAPTDGTAFPDESFGNGHPVPAKAFSGRMLALAVVMIAITIMLAPTVKIFFDKRAELNALSADIAARQAEQDTLRQQISRWQDPNYVKQQARDRINMVMPGESGYWVFGSDLPVGSGRSQGAAAVRAPADLPWVDSLWESVRRAATD